MEYEKEFKVTADDVYKEVYRIKIEKVRIDCATLIE
jgi:hypothetical protein